MSGVNRIILLGNLGKDPEVKHLENGRARTTFTLATNESYKNKEGEKVTNTEWHNVVLWTPLAEIAAQYLSKGRQVYIEGRITTRSYVDKEGQTKYVTEIVGQNMVLLGSKGEGASAIESAGATQHPDTATDEPSDGLPF
ncbi:MAG: single-stranded DNA-binding protein [Bacteroidota bacterium]